MEKIDSYEQCNSLIQDFRNRCNKSVTNFYLLSTEIQETINNNEVWYLSDKDLLVIGIDEEEYSRIYYFASKEVVPILENIGKTMILDLVTRDIDHDKKVNEEVERWRKSGFEEYKIYTRMRYDLRELDHTDEVNVSDISYDLSCAEHEDAEDLLRLWKESLDKYSTPLPSVEQMQRLIESNHVYCIRMKDKIAGAVYMNVTETMCALEHLAINPDFRRQGLGTALMDYALRSISRENVDICCLWVDVDNVPACDSYKKYGFINDRIWSRRLICY